MQESTDATDGEPLVTVAVTVFNGGSDFRLALESLLAQDYPNLEIVLSDDGSTDGSRELCEEVAAADPRCRFLPNEIRLGMLGNYNKLIDNARGKYLLFADQDDRRDPAFASRCVQVLESDPTAVLCHSHTGVVWPSISGRLYHINSLDSVDGAKPVVSRYWRFLRHYTDTTIYGLIRLDALRKTRRWQKGIGSPNRLLFELLLQGPFRQVPEVLFFYTAKGLRDRPDVRTEYLRQTGREPPRLHLPFLVLAAAQTRDVWSARISLHQKAAVVCLLWVHVAMVNAAKAAYRLLWATLRGNVPAWVQRICARLVYSTTDLRFVIAPEEDREYYPEGWPLRAG